MVVKSRGDSSESGSRSGSLTSSWRGSGDRLVEGSCFGDFGFVALRKSINGMGIGMGMGRGITIGHGTRMVTGGTGRPKIDPGGWLDGPGSIFGKGVPTGGGGGMAFG